MGTIIPFLRDSVFAPDDITAMSMALDEVCRVLKLQADGTAKEVMAARIIDLARRGERSRPGSVTGCSMRPAWPNMLAWRTCPSLKRLRMNTSITDPIPFLGVFSQSSVEKFQAL